MAGLLRLLEDIPAEPTNESCATPEFWQDCGRGSKFLQPFTVSLACHVALFFGLPPMAAWLPPEDQPVLVTIVQRPSRDLILYLPAKPPSVTRQEPTPEPNGDRAAGGGGAAAGQSVHGEGLILQPAPVVRPTRQIPEIPSLAVWTGPAPPAAPIEIGSPDPVKESRPSPAKPMIAPPVVSAEVKAIPLPQLQVQTRGPVLPAANAAPVAIVAEPVAAPPTMPGQRIRGSAAAILAVTPVAPKGGEKLIVPPDVSVVGGGNAVPRASSAIPPGLPGSAPGAAPGSGSGPGGAGPTGTGSGGGSGAGSVREWTIPSPSGTIRVTELADGTQQLAYPKDGKYDVVVLQATLPGDFPRPDQFMTGRPIYTVYLNTGWRRDWILQYAEPSKVSANSGMVVSLGKAEKLTDPYVQMAIVPPDGVLRSDGYLLFHGQIDREGHFVNVQAGGSVTDDHRRLLTYLNRWIFRPSMKGNRPVEVEMVLLVPPRPAGQ